MAATDPGAGGGFLGRKLGPLPMWVWLGLAAAGVYLWRQHSAAAQAAAAASQSGDAATSALANQGAAAMQYGYTAPDLASMISNLQGQVALLGGGNTGTTATAPTSPGSTGNPATNPTQTLKGSGYWVPNSEQVLYGQGGHKYEWVPGTSASSLPKGTSVYYEPAPGVFELYLKSGAAPSAKVSPGTPLFLQVG